MTNLRKKKGISGDRNNVQRRGKATASYAGGNTIVVSQCVRARAAVIQFRRLQNLNLKLLFSGDKCFCVFALST